MARTTTVGGTTSGYSLTGRRKSEIAPTRKITIEITPAKIGRLMKNSEMFMTGDYFWAKRWLRRPPRGGPKGEMCDLVWLSLRVGAGFHTGACRRYGKRRPPIGRLAGGDGGRGG